ncbi:MAG: hypothetical protein WCK32_00015 [Chlorobiaceae bacterium]
MSTKDAYRKKVEAELELAQAKLAEFKAKAKTMTEELHVKYTEKICNLEQVIDSAQIKLKEASEAGEGAWVHLKDGVESALRSLNSGLHGLADKFK